MGKHGLKALGLMFLAALCLTAFMASSASANWRVLGAENATNAGVAVETHQTGILLVPSLGLEISCTTVEGKELVLLAKSSETTGKLAFSGCTTKVSGESQPNCNPINQPIVAGGKGHLVLIGTKNLVLFEPETGKPFTIIEFGVNCAATSTSEVTGKLLAECLKNEIVKETIEGKTVELEVSKLEAGDCSEEWKFHLLKQQARTEDELKYGKRAASVDGVAKTSLTGAGFLGEKFSGIV